MPGVPEDIEGGALREWGRPLRIRDATRAIGAALKLRSAPIFVSASAAPAGKAAVAKPKSNRMNLHRHRPPMFELI